MGKNINSEVGASEDLLRAIVQMGCAEIHAMGLYYKTQAEMENGLIDVTDSDILNAHLERAEMFREDIETYATLRRQMTTSLFNRFDGGDKDYILASYRPLKHTRTATMTSNC